METNSGIRIGHLKIIDHLILGISDLRIKSGQTRLSDAGVTACAMHSWNQVSDSLVSGEINAAFMPAPTAMRLYAQGVKIKLLMFVHRSGSRILKNAKADIQSIADFKGRAFLVTSQYTIQTMLLYRLLTSAGLSFGPHGDTTADVRQETVPPHLMHEMVLLDTDTDIGGFAVADPFGARSMDSGRSNLVCTTDSLWKNHPCCVFVVKENLLENHTPIVSDLISLFIDTATLINRGMDHETTALAETYLGESAAAISRMIAETRISFSPEHLVPDMDALNMIQTYMTDTMCLFDDQIDIVPFIDNRLISTLTSPGI